MSIEIHFITNLHGNSSFRSVDRKRKEVTNFMTLFWCVKGITPDRRCSVYKDYRYRNRLVCSLFDQDAESFEDFLNTTQKEYERAGRYSLEWEFNDRIKAYSIKIRRVVKK